MLCVQSWKRQAPELLVHKEIKWKYNPHGAPHHGGSSKILVRSCKHVFYAIIGTRKLTDEVLLFILFCLFRGAILKFSPVGPD